MKLFRHGKKLKQVLEVNYEVGNPIEVYINGEWNLYEVKRHEDGEIYFEPYGFELNINWLYNIQGYETRQTQQTLNQAMEILRGDIEHRQAIINHDREKSEIDKIKEIMARITPRLDVNSGKELNGKT